MKYQRKTRDVWEVEGYYAQGWESVSEYENRTEARQGLKEYRDNERGTSFRMCKRREKIA